VVGKEGHRDDGPGDDGPAGAPQIKPDGPPCPHLESAADCRPDSDTATVELEAETRKRETPAASDSNPDWNS
jgi:hypothetical protein